MPIDLITCESAFSLSKAHSHPHACILFDDMDCYRRVAFNFIREGLDANEKCIMAVDGYHHELIAEDFANAHLNVDDYIQSGKLVILDVGTSYAKEREFDPDQTIEFWQKETIKAVSENFNALRVVGEATFALGKPELTAKTIYYENIMNQVLFKKFPFISLCVYDKKLYSPEILKGVIKAHPILFYNDELFIDNIHYVSPEIHFQKGGAIEEIDIWLENVRRNNKNVRELNEYNERYALALNSSNEGVWDLDLINNKTYFSDAWKKILGYENDEIKDEFSQWERLIKPDYVQKIWHAINDVIERKSERFEMEFPMRHKDGRWIDILSRANVVFDSTGKAVRMVGTHVDITERKRAEKALMESELRYRTLANSGQALIWTSGLDMGCDYFNQPWFDFTGRTIEQEIGAGWTAGIHPDDYDHCLNIYATAFKKRRKFSMEYRLQNVSGVYRWVLDEGTPRFDGKGNFLGYIGHCLDITERKQVEAGLRESEEKNRALLAAIPDLMILFDKDGFLIDYRTYEHKDPIATPASLLNKHFTDVFPPDVADVTQKHLDQVFLSGHLQFYEYAITTDNIIKHFESRLVPCGRAMALSITRNITDQKQAEAEREKLQTQLLQAQKMESVGRLAGGVAHDFNNMLSVIQGYSEIAMEKIPAKDPLQGDLKEILDAARRSADITRQLLAFARKQTISPKVLDLNDTVGNMLKMIRRLIGENIDLSWQPGGNLWSVLMDPAQVDQILANLCVNARDAIGGVGKLTIETKNVSIDSDYCSDHAGFFPGEFLMLAVSDDGHGMDEETRANIFEPFFTTKGFGEGTGLGLSTVYGIVKQNNGFINVYSEKGQGTTFRIYLPKHASPANKGFGRKPAAKLPKGRGETVLIVEDEISILKLAKKMLERLGYTTLAANSPGDAIDLAAKHGGAIDLLITDVVMPEMSGRDLADQLQDSCPDMKVLYMSGYTANVIAHQGVLDEGIHFMQKPFSIREMATMARKTLFNSMTLF